MRQWKAVQRKYIEIFGLTTKFYQIVFKLNISSFKIINFKKEST